MIGHILILGTIGFISLFGIANETETPHEELQCMTYASFQDGEFKGYKEACFARCLNKGTESIKVKVSDGKIVDATKHSYLCEAASAKE
jgi:major membrane immunogen (membrane-anchored lipoprotein)